MSMVKQSGPARTALRRTALPRLVGGVLCLGGAAWGIGVGPSGAQAATVPGSGFGSFQLTGSAAGSQITYSTAGSTSPTLDGEVPDAVSSLQYGPLGEGLAAVAWPGSLAGNAGTTSQVINLPIPSQLANSANDPVRAQAETGSGPSTVTNNTYPGTTMTATATRNTVMASAAIVGSSGPAAGTSTGNTNASSSATLTGASTAQVEAVSRVQNIRLDGGVVTIAEVTSTASATTNGAVARGSGQTVVSGMKIGGIPAQIGQTGLRIGPAGAPTSAVLTQIVDKALASANMNVAVSHPSQQVNGGSITYDAGNVVFYWAPSSQSGTFTMAFGGASVSAAAAPAFPSFSTPPTSGSTGQAGAGSYAPPATGSTGSAPSTSSNLGLNPLGPAAMPAVGPVGAAAKTGGVPQRSRSIVLTATPVDLAHGLSPLWVVLALAATLLAAAGFKRLPDRVLEQAGPECPLERAR
ncbi:MAG: hypothetical protein ACYCV7_09455 [Acidimicrobiales bacterium]